MPSTTVENDRIEVPAGTTAGGRELRIVSTPLGHYKIEAVGEGAPLGLTDETFTSLSLARRALDQYYRANAKNYAKEAAKTQTINSPTIKERRRLEREAAALELKNGELETPEETE